MVRLGCPFDFYFVNFNQTMKAGSGENDISQSKKEPFPPGSW